MAWVEPNQGDTILASHVTQLTKAARGAAGFGQDIAYVQRNNPSDYANKLGNVDTTNGYALRVQYGPAASPTSIATFAKAGVTFSVPVTLSDISTGNLVTLTGTQTLTNKTLTSPVINTPTGDVATKTGAETLTNKTLTTPVIATISNTGSLTLPTSTDTLVGRATTDTLTNKTLTAPVIATISNSGTVTIPTGTDTLVNLAGSQSLSNKTLASPVLSGTVSGAGTIPTAVLAANAVTQSGVATTGGADSTTSTTFVDMASMSVTLTTGGGDLLVFAVGAYTHSGATVNTQVGFRLDSGSDISGPAVHSNPTVGASVLWANVYLFTGVSAASHTVKSRWLTGSGTVTAYGGRTMVVVELKR